jgi:AraC-like DNA-binding protein
MERGDLESIMPPAELRPFVRRYLYTNRTLGAGLTLHAKPTGYAYFSNFLRVCDGDYGIINGHRIERATRWNLFGQILDHEVHFHHAGRLEFLAGELTPTAPYRLFGIPGEAILGLACSLGDAAPQYVSLARECFVRGVTASRDEHISEGNMFFSRLSEQALPQDAIVEQAVMLIEAANGAVRVADICRTLGVGERQLNRKFKRIVGLTPKHFARILQMNWVVGLLYAKDAATLTDIAHSAGFYDQAHFYRAMNQFFRESPRAFLESDHPAFRSFLAASRLGIPIGEGDRDAGSGDGIR